MTVLILACQRTSIAYRMDGADDGVFGLDLDGDVFEATTRERDVDEEKKSAFSEDKKRQFWLAKRRRQREKVVCSFNTNLRFR